MATTTREYNLFPASWTTANIGKLRAGWDSFARGICNRRDQADTILFPFAFVGISANISLQGVTQLCASSVEFRTSQMTPFSLPVLLLSLQSEIAGMCFSLSRHPRAHNSHICSPLRLWMLASRSVAASPKPAANSRPPRLKSQFFHLCLRARVHKFLSSKFTYVRLFAKESPVLFETAFKLSVFFFAQARA